MESSPQPKATPSGRPRRRPSRSDERRRKLNEERVGHWADPSSSARLEVVSLASTSPKERCNQRPSLGVCRASVARPPCGGERHPVRERRCREGGIFNSASHRRPDFRVSGFRRARSSSRRGGRTDPRPPCNSRHLRGQTSSGSRGVDRSRGFRLRPGGPSRTVANALRLRPTSGAFADGAAPRRR